jgi:hypothetical protein
MRKKVGCFDKYNEKNIMYLNSDVQGAPIHGALFQKTLEMEVVNLSGHFL